MKSLLKKAKQYDQQSKLNRNHSHCCETLGLEQLGRCVNSKTRAQPHNVRKNKVLKATKKTENWQEKFTVLWCDA